MVSVGKDATLSCQIVGNPTPQVSWEKDRQLVEAGGRFRLAQDGDLYRLTILDLALGDSAEGHSEVAPAPSGRLSSLDRGVPRWTRE